jgi:hypothetical protein
MDGELREYFDLRNKIKGWFIYNLGREDNQELDAMISEVSFGLLRPGNQADREGLLASWGLSKLPTSLVTDLEKLGEINLDIDTEQWMATRAQKENYEHKALEVADDD